MTVSRRLLTSTAAVALMAGAGAVPAAAATATPVQASPAAVQASPLAAGVLLPAETDSSTTTARPQATWYQRSQMLRLVNAFRASQGRPPVKMSLDLNASAQRCADAVAKAGIFEHCTENRVPGIREYHDAFPEGWALAGENLAGNLTTLDRAMQQWIDSPSHRANMLEHHTHMGFGMAPGGLDGMTIYTQHFADYPDTSRLTGGLLFHDNPPTRTGYGAVQWMSQMGITEGYRDNTFRPSRSISRGEVVAFMQRYLAPDHVGRTTTGFTDVPLSSTFFNAVSWASSTNVSRGYTDGSFRMNRPVTRAEFATMLHRSQGSPKVSSTRSFSDVSTTSYYAQAVTWLKSTGLSSGYLDGTFRPNRQITRGEVALVLHRLDLQR